MEFPMIGLEMVQHGIKMNCRIDKVSGGL